MQETNATVKRLIEHLNLEPLQWEGGYFRQTYKSKVEFKNSKEQTRSTGTCIYYLVTKNSYSGLHRVSSDEVFHFYCGSPVEMLLLNPNGEMDIITIGANILEGETPQFVVPANWWQGTMLKEGEWALLGCSVSPGFEFDDFELAKTELVDQYPEKNREKILQYIVGHPPKN